MIKLSYDEKLRRKYQIAYETAQEMLVKTLPEGYSFESLNGYFRGDNIPTSLQDVFRQLIGSAQNAQRKSNVIKFWDREDEIKSILSNYDIIRLSQTEPLILSELLRAQFKDTREDNPKNTWRQWANSVIDSAKFVSQFRTLDDFKSFVEFFNINEATRAALPLYIAERIRGIGFALACDSLKELGYLEYPKPDVHINDICEGLDFCDRDNLSVFDTVVAIARACNETPYKVDKVFWLLCSGNFYKGYDYCSTPEKKPGQKQEYINEAKKRIAAFM